MSSGPGGSGDADSNEEAQAFTQGFAETAYAPNPDNVGGLSDAAVAALADINQEPTSLEDYDVSGQIFGFGQPSFAPAGTPQVGIGDQVGNIVKGIEAEDIARGVLGFALPPQLSVPLAIGSMLSDPTRGEYYPNMMPKADYTLGNMFGLGPKGAFPDDENAYEFDPNDTRNVFNEFPEAVTEGEDPADPYARRRYLLPTPQTTAPVEPMVNNPLPLTPYDYQKQKWMGNQFVLAPIRRT